jgi:hypothetical protein
MGTDWNPRSKYPDDIVDFATWFVNDLELFRKSRSDLPQGALGIRARNKVIRAWTEAREMAEQDDAKKISPEYYQAVRTFHRTGTIKLPLTKKKAGSSRRKKSDRD